MFNKEEEKLEKWKDEIEKQDVPQDELKLAIRQGLQRAKHAKKAKKSPTVKRGVWSAVVAAILLITFITSIRVSPAFASAVASIPGMEGVVHLIQDNKGLIAAIDNEYYQELNVSSEKEGVTLTIEGVIADEQEIVIFHSVKGSKKNEKFSLLLPVLLDKAGKPIFGIGHTVSRFEGNEEDAVQTTGRSHIRLMEEVNESELIFKATIESNLRSIDYEIPFSLIKEKMPTTRYPINETVSIEGQKVTIKQIEISPVKVSVHVKIDPENTKEIFAFEDLRLVDDKGETWTSISNGVVATRPDENEQIIFLQSNYFEQPTTLTLKFNRLQALAKEEAYVLVDTEEGVILEQPADQRFSALQINNSYMGFSLKAEKGYHTSPFSSIIDAEGNEFHLNGGTFRAISDELIELSEDLPNKAFVNPIKLPLVGYPQWIEGEVGIKIK